MRDEPNVPYGHCHCGCGQRTTIASHTHHKYGYVKGEPKKYMAGHGSRITRYREPYRVEDRGHDTPCWIWQGAPNAPNGYGTLSVAGRSVLAYRFYYERDVGPVPEGLQLDHLCRVRLCVNPQHLESVTHAENVRRGALTKLTAAQVEDIRRRAVDGSESQRVIAKDYGVSQSLVSCIKLGKVWADGPNSRRQAA